jgi:hypothetical protein
MFYTHHTVQEIKREKEKPYIDYISEKIKPLLEEKCPTVVFTPRDILERSQEGSEKPAYFFCIVFIFTHICIHCLGHLPSPTLQAEPVPPSCSLILLKRKHK